MARPPAPNRPTGSPKLPFRTRKSAGGRPRQKGDPKTPGSGRKKGTGNFVTSELREFFNEFYKTPEYQQSLQKRILEGRAQPIELNGWHIAIGKPRETVDVHSEDLDHLFGLAVSRGLDKPEKGDGA